jgi:pSer/pThr/pTyr-binding forkhead associated (FHA) protein
VIHVLNAPSTTLGRRPENAIVLTGDSFVSGSHAKIAYTGSGFVIEDLGSTNGTHINGRRLEARAAEPLKDGDTVVFGRSEYTFHSPQ